MSNDPQGMNVINKMLSITDIAKYRVTNENEIAITFTPKNIQKLFEYFTEKYLTPT
ncbi:hypothetical protein LLO_3008 [Legionella longbeachae NSW150]|uniref:Uncharacterized protein n=1 Tax=Legionella longbeachae serogroup 1 (strain NSW150) TaxID=661367 RepID=D3HLX5_LEGLN|nr:hypothetical protein LLB_3823 [Legionella longbeachae D-4968]CBJ13455.1 hypothetical protein LLO_3008 [Legionella longbeachae NSW150]